MKKEKLLMATAAATMALLLQACSSAPRLSPEQRAEIAKSTFNVYEDNRVWFKAAYGDTNDYWAWTSDNKNDILALLIDGHAYNAKDLAKLTATQVRGGYNINVQLKSGQTLSAFSAYGMDNVAWLACDTKKVCPRRHLLTGIGINYNLGILTAIREYDLTKIPTGKPQADLIRDYRVVPSLSNLREVRFLDEAGQTELRNKFARQEQRWEQVVRDRQQREEAARAAFVAREQAIEAEAVDLRKHMRVGTRTNCGQVFEVRLPMIGVQTINGMQFIDVSRLFGPSAGCRFYNGQYVGR